MSQYAPVIKELEEALSNLMDLWGPLAVRRIRAARYDPGSTVPVDVTVQYSEGLRKATDALTKAVAVVKNLEPGS